MKIALLHFALLDGPQANNIEKLYQGAKLAAEAGASWVIAPEMAVQGYRMYCTGKPFSLLRLEQGVTEDNYQELLRNLDTEASTKRRKALLEKYGIEEEEELDPTKILQINESNESELVSEELLSPLQELAQTYGLTIICGCGTVDKAGPHNSAVVINSEGNISAHHHKIKVVKWITEEWAAAGRALVVNTVDGVQLGLLVCADTWFEEHGQAYRNMGAELLLAVAAWPDGGCGGPPVEAWKRTSRASGGLPLIVCNQTGKFVMDCTKAKSALVEKGEALCTYEGEEAVLLCDYSPEEKCFLSTEFQCIPFKL